MTGSICTRGAMWVLGGVVVTGAAPVGADAGPAATVRVQESTRDRIILRYEFGAGNAPTVSHSVIVPDDAQMAMRIIDGSAFEMTWADFAAQTDWPPPDDSRRSMIAENSGTGPVVELGTPYVLRDYRGLCVTVHAVRPDPGRLAVHVLHDLTVELAAVGRGTINVLQRNRPVSSVCRTFDEIYRSRFINYDLAGRFPPPDEEGEMLIIVHDPWMAEVQTLAQHKNAIGINTTVVGVSEIGSTVAAIKSYIQDMYATTDLAFVLLVGDAAQVPTPCAGGSAADPVYAKVAGADDYPDLMIGRFSAESAMHVQTQVQRTIAYETNGATEQDWFWRGAGIGSSTAAGHLDDIRQDLLDYGYTQVDQLYDPGVTPEMIGAAINEGRGVINYVGQGGTTLWGTGPFTIAHVEALTNNGMLPFIFNVACLNGDFDGQTCLAEAWLRAMHDGAPTGAIAAYMSSSSQSWIEPLTAHEAIIDTYVNEDLHAFGALCFAGACKMIDEYGSSGAETFNNWIVFGDPSLRIVGTVEFVCPADITGDGMVDVLDLLALLAAWGQTGELPEDITGDGIVDTLDLLALLAAWGPCDS